MLHPQPSAATATRIKVNLTEHDDESPAIRSSETHDAGFTEHDIAAQLPPEMTGISGDGTMQSHRTPIVSIHGKDIDPNDDARSHAA